MKQQIMAALCAAALFCCVSAPADITGFIRDDTGAIIPSARVFVEPGIDGAVVEGTTAADGAFSVAGDFYGNVGVFAHAPGHGFGGVHLTVAAGDQPANIRITLAPETQITGMVTDSRGAPIAGARVSSIAITQPVKVGIPLSKLADFGITTPTSDASGRFRIDAAPRNAVMALKIDHPLYAQGTVMDVNAGATEVKAVLHRGVQMRGQVFIRGADAPVSGATVAARNAQPPHDTAFSVSDGAGVFTMRLNPGVYLFQAHAAGRISPGFQQVVVSGDSLEQQIRLGLSETSQIAGTIHDARTGEPIPGVRVMLETQGQPAGAARTGANGRFLLRAAAGDNTLHFEDAPGYLPPDTRALRVSAPGGDTLELPGLWLAPIPDFTLRVFEDDGETPVAGAFIALLRPQQFGWQQTDGDGRATLRFTTLPEDNRVIGFVEHPARDKGALFALDRNNGETGAVALLPLATVTGRVVNDSGAPVVGAAVGALFADDTLPEALPLWRCLTDGDGVFHWPAAPAGVPQRCVAALGSLEAAAQHDINPRPTETLDVGVITLSGAVSEPPTAAHHYQALPHLCGPVATPGASGIVALYCTPAKAAVYTQAAAGIREHLRAFGFETLVAVTGAYVCDHAQAPVYEGGDRPLATYVYNHEGALTLRAMGLPPIAWLRALQPEQP